MQVRAKGEVGLKVSLERVDQEDMVIFRNLYSLYLHDLSRFTENLEIASDGSFQFDGLEVLWDKEGFSPFFIKHSDELIGFLLLLERPLLKKDNDFGINDMFILNKFRGKGFGQQTLERLFMDKPGKYFVIELSENRPAVMFWKKIYRQFHIKFDEREESIDDEPCLVQTFTVGADHP